MLKFDFSDASFRACLLGAKDALMKAASAAVLYAITREASPQAQKYLASRLEVDLDLSRADASRWAKSAIDVYTSPRVVLAANNAPTEEAAIAAVKGALFGETGIYGTLTNFRNGRSAAEVRADKEAKDAANAAAIDAKVKAQADERLAAALKAQADELEKAGKALVAAATNATVPPASETPEAATVPEPAATVEPVETVESVRVEASKALDALMAEVTSLRGKLVSVENERDALAVQVQDRDRTIDNLRSDLAVQVAESQRLQREAQAAQAPTRKASRKAA